MTSKTRTTIEPRDILAVELECKECGSRSIRPIKLALTGAEKCPNCSTVWPVQLATELNQLATLVSMASAVAGWQNRKDVPFSVRFEIAEQEDTP
jgi:uncharacterized Zn finger protein